MAIRKYADKDVRMIFFYKNVDSCFKISTFNVCLHTLRTTTSKSLKEFDSIYHTKAIKMEAKIIEMLARMGEKIEFIERKMIENEPQEYLTVKESCQFAKISRTTFNELKNDGLIEFSKVRGKILIKKSELIAMIDRHMTPNRA